MALAPTARNSGIYENIWQSKTLATFENLCVRHSNTRLRQRHVRKCHAQSDKRHHTSQ